MDFTHQLLVLMEVILISGIKILICRNLGRNSLITMPNVGNIVFYMFLNDMFLPFITFWSYFLLTILVKPNYNKN
jgi:hypothetical protein